METNQSCKCIDNISEQLKQHYGEFHFNNLRSYIDSSSIVGSAKIIYKPQPLMFEVRGKNKDGSPSSKWIKR